MEWLTIAHLIFAAQWEAPLAHLSPTHPGTINQVAGDHGPIRPISVAKNSSSLKITSSTILVPLRMPEPSMPHMGEDTSLDIIPLITLTSFTTGAIREREARTFEVQEQSRFTIIHFTLRTRRMPPARTAADPFSGMIMSTRGRTQVE